MHPARLTLSYGERELKSGQNSSWVGWGQAQRLLVSFKPSPPNESKRPSLAENVPPRLYLLHPPPEQEETNHTKAIWPQRNTTRAAQTEQKESKAKQDGGWAGLKTLVGT